MFILDNYKELYFFLFNRITDMIQELQLLQQQAEEAFMNGYDQQPAWHVQQALPDAADPASHILPSLKELDTYTHALPESPEATSSDALHTKSQQGCSSPKSPLPFERPSKPQFPLPTVSTEFVHLPAANDFER